MVCFPSSLWDQAVVGQVPVVAWRWPRQRSIAAFTLRLCVFSRLPWFLQLLHRRGVSGGTRAARDGAELCFCFRHGGQEANEEVVGHADDELQQPARGWHPLLRPAHLHQAPRPRQRAVLRPRPLQRHGQPRLLLLFFYLCDEYVAVLTVAKQCLRSYVFWGKGTGC